jgi:hypothetical protein
MANQPTLTGSLAIIRCKGTTIGLMKNISVTENFQRADVQGLGTILTSEAPVTAWRGTLQCSWYEIDFKTSGFPGAIRRDVQTGQQFEDQLMLDNDGIQVDIFKKVADVIGADGLVKAKVQPFAIIKNVLIESEGFDITEGQVSGQNGSFRYLSPILYPA